MKLCGNVIGYIGNPNFCTADEAFEYAKESNYPENWKIVLSRADLSLSKAILGAKIAKKSELWKIVLSRPDMDSTTALHYAVKLGDDDVWETVLGRPDLNDLETAYARATALDNLDVWISVLSRKDGDPGAVIKKAVEIDDPSVWNAVLELEHISPYLKQLGKNELLELAKCADNYNLWIKLLDREDIDSKDALTYAKMVGYSAVWEIIFKMESVIAYLESLSSEGLILLAKELKVKKFWEKVLKMGKVKPEEAFFNLKETDDDFIWQRILKREDVKKYLDSLIPKDLISLALKISHWRIWKIIIERPEVINYLNTLGSKEAITLCIEADNVHLTDLIIERSDFAFTDAFEIAKNSKNGCAWSAATKKPDFLDYINVLGDDDATYFALQYNDPHIWKIVLARKSIAPSKAIEYAKTANDEKVWDVVRLRSDVISYLELKK